MQPKETVSFEQVFIATPTHTCKRYCAAAFLNAVQQHAHGARHHIFCNSRGSGATWYQRAGVNFLDMKFHESHPQEGYFCKPDSIHKRITETAKSLRHLFLSYNLQYYLSLEADVLLGEHTLQDMLERIDSYQADVMHTNCYRNFNTATEVSDTKRLTMGCTLIRRRVLEAIDFRYDPAELRAHYDAYFANDCEKHGFKMIYDPSIVVHHAENSQGRGWQELPPAEKALPFNP